MKSFLLLIGGAFLLWAALLWPGWLLQGEQVLCQSLTALGLCLVPTAASLAWIVAAKKTPDAQLIAILGGTGLRLSVAAGGGFLLHESFPETFPYAFFAWVGVFYAAALALEIPLALKVSAAAETASRPTGSLSSAR